ncbi:MAG: FAS1-like dehydratase domain-containing protein [Pseudonocardiaceae bacterium]
MSASVLTDEIRALIGHVGPVVVAPLPYSDERHRRFMHALMEDQAMHLDAGAAASSKYGALVAPPLMPMHSLMRALGDPDPLDALLTDPDWDGLGVASSTAMPPIPTSLKRVLNGGTEAEFCQLLRIGDVVHAQAKSAAIEERLGTSGPMLLVKTEITYKNQDGDVLAVVTMTVIRR